jgi:TRAP-type C4-dicarboxylate transport system permease small subunit
MGRLRRVGLEEIMSIPYRKAMDALYLLCVGVAGAALVLISAVIPWGVYTRYIQNSAASWPEPTAVLLTIVLTFIGAAACYRVGSHMSVSVLVRMMPPLWRRLTEFLAEALVGALAVFMVIYGSKLVEATWHQSIADFPLLSVGLTYLPIPIGGAITFLFVLERLLIGRPPPEEEASEGVAGHG